MSLFDNLVQTALRADRELGVIQPVVEKELLHHDIPLAHGFSVFRVRSPCPGARLRDE